MTIVAIANIWSSFQSRRGLCRKPAFMGNRIRTGYFQTLLIKCRPPVDRNHAWIPENYHEIAPYQQYKQEMEGDEDDQCEGGGETTVEEARTPGDDDNGVIGDGDDRGDHEDHEVAKDAKAGAEAEGVRGGLAKVHDREELVVVPAAE